MTLTLVGPRIVSAFEWASKVLKQEEPPVPAYVSAIAAATSAYEEQLRGLWESYKQNPTEENAEAFADAVKRISEEYWPEYIADILGVEFSDLTERQQNIINEAIDEHHDYVDNSLLPDIVKVVREEGLLEVLDHRVIFMYAGALWSLGFLTTVMFDGTSVRDLGDIFVMMGPDDEATCRGPRGCHNFVNKPFTVAQILAQDIIPGRFQCLTNCRHYMIPVASPLQQSQKHLPGKHDQSTHAPRKRAGGGAKVWNGEQMKYDGKKVSKLQAGEIGEKLAMKVLSQTEGVDFQTLNVGVNNAPIDVGGDHLAVEVKTGLATNGKTAQHWRATIGQPGVAERAAIAKMSKEEKRAHHDYKRSRILERKNAMLADMSEAAGSPVKPVTIGIILHPDGSRGDVYRFEGFHQRIPWSAAETQGTYLGTHIL